MVTFYRRLPKFDYVKPKSLDEALDFIKGLTEGGARVYAGGTDLIPRLKARLTPVPGFLVDLKGIPGLNAVEYSREKGLRIGATATITSVAHHGAVKERFGILSQGAASIASNQVRNRGTIAGNICNAVPSADSAPALLCLGAKLKCVSPRGERVIGIEDFFTGPSKTALDPDELLREIMVPEMPQGSGGAYIKLSTRSRMDLALVGVGAVVSVKDGLFQDVRIGLGAVAPTPLRATKAEERLRGEKVGEGVIAEAGRLAAEASAPIDDHRASAEYRRLMVEVLVKRAIGQALKG
ncbi:MAG: xanthine dehydrogenase family protein subunit M [Pseudomonadota bacterium]